MLTGLGLLASCAGFNLYAGSTCLLTFGIGMGAMVGPGVAGALADSGSFTPVLGAAGAAIILSIVLMRYSDGFRG